MTELAALLPGVPSVESPFFEGLLPSLPLSLEEHTIARALNRNGFAIIDFPDPAMETTAERIKTNLAPRFSADLTDPESIKALPDQRVQDAWQFDDDVRAVATNPQILDLLSRLYGRRAIPFQTLNFSVGTQQSVHSDAVHFSSQPERFMCGVWLALEDIHPDAGPLSYCPGSHTWPIISNAMLGTPRYGDHAQLAQTPYEPVWNAILDATATPTLTFTPRKGQALIWAANLLHGGMPQLNPRLTRWSQVTHYFFEDCIYYTPAYSEEPLGKLELRSIVNIATGASEPNRLFGRDVQMARRPRGGLLHRLSAAWKAIAG